MSFCVFILAAVVFLPCRFLLSVFSLSFLSGFGLVAFLCFLRIYIFAVFLPVFMCLVTVPTWSLGFGATSPFLPVFAFLLFWLSFAPLAFLGAFYIGFRILFITCRATMPLAQCGWGRGSRYRNSP